MNNKEEQESQATLSELVTSGGSLFSEETRVELGIRGESGEAQAYEGVVRKALLTGKPTFREVGEKK